MIIPKICCSSFKLKHFRCLFVSYFSKSFSLSYLHTNITSQFVVNFQEITSWVVYSAFFYCLMRKLVPFCHYLVCSVIMCFSYLYLIGTLQYYNRYCHYLSIGYSKKMICFLHQLQEWLQIFHLALMSF